MDRMPPTTALLSRNSLDETFVLILADDKERQALRTHTSPRTCYCRAGERVAVSLMGGSLKSPERGAIL
jgi:hypothetical protein